MKIWIVWATNVWKSTLFNRLIWQFRAIVTDIHWTTTDIIQHQTQIDDLGSVSFFDSPGLSSFQAEQKFIRKIIDESDLILFVIDDSAGITAKESSIFDYIIWKNKKKNTILVINKIDKNYKEKEYDMATADYHHLWFEKIIWVSGKKWKNIDLLKMMVSDYFQDQIWKWFFKNTEEEKETKFQKPDWIAIAIMWKPNVGKSTLLNKFVGKYLSKVENLPWTTRDYIVGSFEYWKQKYTIYDTAGIKNKWSMHWIEKIAYDKTLDMLKFIRPIVLFLVDSVEDISHRDKTILHEIEHIALPIIFCLNKTDLLNNKESKIGVEKAKFHLNFAKHIPIIPISAKIWTGTNDIFDMIKNIKQEVNKRIETNKLNKIISTEIITRPPRFPKNKICKIFYITQTDVDAPTFIAFVNHKDRANFAFKKWIDNVIRKHFGFIWVPLIIKFRERTEKENEEK